MLTAAYLSQEGWVLRATVVLVATWSLITTTEWIANRYLFSEDALLSWRLLSLRPGRIFHGNIGTVLFSRRTINFVLVVRLTTTFALLVNSDLVVDVIGLGIIASTNWLLMERCWLGADGSDQMGQIVTLGALIAACGLLVNDHYVFLAGMILIAGQLALSYIVAGIAKLVSPTWRSGRAIRGIMDTYTYGHPLTARLSHANIVVCMAICWAITLAETAIPLALFMPKPILFVALGLATMFQLGNAYFMGLNTFVWSFSAAYPAAIIISTAIRGAW
jgi:hypothetical protein